MNQGPLVLCILDGWGHRPDAPDNSITRAHPPHWEHLWDRYPHTLLQASGQAVGLPEGQMGNSEVGHMTMGAGKVLDQDLPRIHEKISQDTLKNEPQIMDFLSRMRETGGTVHLWGLWSPGGVHSHQDHLLYLYQHIKSQGIPIVVHGVLDGRDTPPQSALEYISKSPIDPEDWATIMGRFYAMDRDHRWDRTEKAFNSIVHGEGLRESNILKGIQDAYDRQENDEFLKPLILNDYEGFKEGDGFLCGNFRADRVRQILNLLREKASKFLSVKLGMVSYGDDLDPSWPSILSPQRVFPTLGSVLSDCGIPQLRMAETEKYAHVTFFLNGGVDQPFPGEDRILVPSPLVATYDLKPEMSAMALTDILLEKIDEGKHPVIIINYANADMVGHTGNQNAGELAVLVLDQCLDRLTQKILHKKGILMITADHGNVEQMKDPLTAKPHTAHTTYPVPFLWVSNNKDIQLRDGGNLTDIAPTILRYLGLDVPEKMTGQPLQYFSDLANSNKTII
jgi:2,3-bisphosphoglycerate-independent phosphoglycerate mutase